MQAGMVAVASVFVVLSMVASAQFQPLTPADHSDLFQRTDLAEAGSLEGAQRVVRFVQVSDAHIIDDDAPYPIRQEPLDPLGDPVDAAQRPQEEYTDEVLDRIIAAINALHATDGLDFIINTGDNIDNELENELMRFLDNWEGTTTTKGPVSGFQCVPDGQSTSVSDTGNDASDKCTHLPEAMQAQTALAPGLPWFSAFGNHDALIQGNVPVEPSFQETAARYGRYFISQTEYVGMHFRAGSQCPGGLAPAGDFLDDFGHGYAFAGERLCDEDPDNDGYYAFNLRGIRFIVLDTVNDDFVTANSNLQGSFNPQENLGYDIFGGYAEGALDPAQAAWFLNEIDTNQDRLIIVFSHHTVNSMFSKKTAPVCCGPGGESLEDLLAQAGYMTAKQLEAELSARPHVMAWIGGHTHRHRIEAKDSSAGGFWNIETSSLIDMPQQARAIELWVTADGKKAFLAMRSFDHDYQKSKDLAAGDGQWNAATAQGDPDDGDVLLWFDLPGAVRLTPQPTLPRALILTPVSPMLRNGSHAAVGDEVRLAVAVTDNLLRQPVAGLNASVRVVHTSTADHTTIVRDLDGPLAETAPGVYEASFTVEEPVTHFATYRMVDPAGTFPTTEKAVSVFVDLEPLEVTGKKSPAPGFLIVGLAFLWLARQKR